MEPHRLIFGGYSGKFSTRQILLKFMVTQMLYKLNTMFMKEMRANNFIP